MASIVVFVIAFAVGCLTAVVACRWLRQQRESDSTSPLDMRLDGAALISEGGGSDRAAVGGFEHRLS
jgi:hypothetical protein